MSDVGMFVMRFPEGQGGRVIITCAAERIIETAKKLASHPNRGFDVRMATAAGDGWGDGQTRVIHPL